MTNVLANIAEAASINVAKDAGTLMGILINNILNPAVGVLIAIAVVLFLYGVIKYISSGDDEEGRKNAKNYIIYGIIGLFVMVSVWGLVGILTGTFGTNQDVPGIPNLLPK